MLGYFHLISTSQYFRKQFSFKGLPIRSHSTKFTVPLYALPEEILSFSFLRVLLSSTKKGHLTKERGGDEHVSDLHL